MAPPSVEPLPLYRPRNPRASGLWQVIQRHFETFRQVYDERFAAKYGFWRPIVERSVTAFLKCGDLHEGFARVRCPDCGHEMFVAFSCKQRCACPSCHQKRALQTSRRVAEEVCFPVAHRQVVLTIPKRLRLHARFDRKLLGKLSACAWRCVRDEVRRLLARDDALPGMIVAIQTHGELLHWHPHIHALVTCGAFTPAGEFLEVAELDKERLRSAWREEVFALYLAEGKIDAAVVENMRGWPHSGFGAHQSAPLAADDRAGIERLTQYITRCPFSLSRLVRVSGGLSQFSSTDAQRPLENGTVPFASGEYVIYRAEKDACRAFPDPRDAGLAAGTKRNFQVLPALDFLAEFTQHIPPKGAHLIRYYGWYSNKSRGMRRKAAEAEEAARRVALALPVSPCETQPPARRRCDQTWAMLIKRVYEVDPLACPQCGAAMKVLSFIEPPQGAVIEKILRHCGLWRESSPRGPPLADELVYVPDVDGPEFCEEWDWAAGPSTSRTSKSVEPGELTFVDEATFWVTF